MRQTVRTLLFAGMLFSATGAAFAEPVVAGHHLAEIPAGATPVFLAHVFNADQTALKAGSYEIGLEISGGTGRKVFSLKPTSDVEAGRVRTFRMPLKSVTTSPDGNFRVFVRSDKKTSFSEAYSLGNHRLGGAIHAKETSLYTEAPPESNDANRTPSEVPFEEEVVQLHVKGTKTAKSSSGTQKTGPAKLTATKKTALTLTTAMAGTSSVVLDEKKASRPGKAKDSRAVIETAPRTIGLLKEPLPVVPAKPRTIDASEFKTIRTIDEELVIYVIRAGDTLKSVAERYYGSAAKERSIMEFNFIDDPKSVKVGEEVIVEVKPLKAGGGKDSAKTSVAEPEKTVLAPGKPAAIAQAASVASPAKPTSANCSGATYVIQPGDNLGKIAKTVLGKATMASKLLQANPGLNPKNLKVGTTILIPENSGKQG